MKLFLFTIFTLLFITNNNAQIYVAVDGDDDNPGTIEQPFKTIIHAITLAGPDSIIYVRGGIHYYDTTIRLNKSGQPDKRIKLWGYPGETVIIDFTDQPFASSSRGIQISHNYWHVKDLQIRYAKDNGIYISSWHNIIENCITYWNQDTGIQLSGGAANNKILNCDSFENYDPVTNGENADGFAAKLNIGPGNEFIGCRAWLNADDGWDLYEGQNSVLIDQCWAFANGFNIWGSTNFQGDGNGFKLGGNNIPAIHTITRSVAFDNRGKGFDQNNNTAGVFAYNNTAWRNQGRNYSFPRAPNQGNGDNVFKNNISFQGLNQINTLSLVEEKNSWNGFTVSTEDFLSFDTSFAKSPRMADSTLPTIDFLRLAEGSPLIDAGVPVGLPYNDSAPDLGAFETDGEPSSVNDLLLADNFILLQNYPNPFNPITNFVYNLNKSENVSLIIYDILGKEVAEVVNEYQSAGQYNIKWEAKDNYNNSLPSGIYFARLKSGSSIKIIKLSLLK